jgi:hypothetical protein
VREVRNSYGFGRPEGKSLLENLEVDGREL